MPILPSPDAVAYAAAELFVREAKTAAQARGRFLVALSGGSTPKKLHALLASDEFRDQVPWAQTVVVFGDDRYVPPTDPQSNEKMARETLLSLVPVPEENIYAPYRPGGPDVAAQEYEVAIRGLFAPEDPPILDLVLLGLGPDGHTASLFPSQPGVYEREHLVIGAKAPVNAAERVTMTPPILTTARLVAFLVVGEDKADAVSRCLEGAENYDETPSQAIARQAPHVTWLLDEAAAGLLKNRDR